MFYLLIYQLISPNITVWADVGLSGMLVHGALQNADTLVMVQRPDAEDERAGTTDVSGARVKAAPAPAPLDQSMLNIVSGRYGGDGGRCM
jgi:hypothetical protein